MADAESSSYVSYSKRILPDRLVEKLEPGSGYTDLTPGEAATFSAAASLKRIADQLDRLAAELSA